MIPQEAGWLVSLVFHWNRHCERINGKARFERQWCIVSETLLNWKALMSKSKDESFEFDDKALYE